MDFYWIQMVLKQWGIDCENEFYEHGGTRTPDSQNRNLMLYPTELHAQISVCSFLGLLSRLIIDLP